MTIRPQHDLRDSRQRALVSKIVPSTFNPPTYNSEGNRRQNTANTMLFEQISDVTASTISDIESMYQLLPDMELATTILVSSILSPKDLSIPRLRFLCESKAISSSAAAKLLEFLEDYFVNDYKINSDLSRIITDALVKKGAVARMIVPESSLDQIINDRGPVTLEAVSEYIEPSTGDIKLPVLGMLGDVKPPAKDKPFTEATMESAFDTLLAESAPTSYTEVLSLESVGSNGVKEKKPVLTVTDNPEVLRVPALLDKLRKSRTSEILRNRYVTLESVAEKHTSAKEEGDDKDGLPFAGLTDREIDRALEKNRGYDHKLMIEIRNKHQADRPMRGHPLDMELPIESVIPAYVPGSPHEHVGYYIALDAYGYPLNTSTIDDHYRQLQSSFKKNDSNDNTLSQVVRELRGTYGSTNNHHSEVESIMHATDQFAEIVEKNILQRVRSGTGNMSLVLSRPTHLYQIMLARVAAKKRTQLLYVPTELMSYLAFYHGHNGVGKSILENTRILGGVRVLLMFTNAINHVRNAVPRTELAIDLDPQDTDPLGTITMIRNAFMRSRSDGFPLGEGRPDAALNYLHRASVDVVYNGHEDLPEMKIETRDSASNRTTFDDNIEEDYRERHIMAFGISPETVDASKRVDFATTIVNSSLLLSKRVLNYQITFEEEETSRIRKYTNNSEPLLTGLLKIADELDEEERNNLDTKDIVEHFLADFKVELPKPDGATLRSKMEAFQEYERAANDAVKYFVSDDMAMADAEGDMGRNLREYQQAWVALLMREYIEENDIMPELVEKFAKGTDEVALFNFAEKHAEHMDALLETMRDYIDKATLARAKREAMSEEEQKNIAEKVIAYMNHQQGVTVEPEDVDAGGDDGGSDDSASDDTSSDDTGSDDTGTDDGAADTGGDDDLDDDLFDDDFGGDDTPQEDDQSEAPVEEETPAEDPVEDTPEPEPVEEPEPEQEPVEEEIPEEEPEAEPEPEPVEEEIPEETPEAEPEQEEEEDPEANVEDSEDETPEQEAEESTASSDEDIPPEEQEAPDEDEVDRVSQIDPEAPDDLDEEEEEDD